MIWLERLEIECSLFGILLSKLKDILPLKNRKPAQMRLEDQRPIRLSTQQRLFRKTDNQVLSRKLLGKVVFMESKTHAFYERIFNESIRKRE